jgi:hypothetical protein
MTGTNTKMRPLGWARLAKSGRIVSPLGKGLKRGSSSVIVELKQAHEPHQFVETWRGRAMTVTARARGDFSPWWGMNAAYLSSGLGDTPSVVASLSNHSGAFVSHEGGGL